MTARLLGIVFVLGACGDNRGKPMDGPDAGPPDAPPDAAPGSVPRVEPAACKFGVSPSLGLDEGVGYTCGDLIVHENRAQPTRTIRLHYIQFKNPAGGAERATIYLDGGPGSDGAGIVAYANALGPTFLQGLLSDGDFLVLGQRGTALSQPFLDCVQPDCGDFAAIADLPSYNTAYNADDVDDLRAALGYSALNLYGISYGSRLGLEVLRRHGDRVRAAVIEGLVPSQVIWPAAIPASFHGALTALHAACADTGSCGSAYGDLVAKFTAGVDALNANPAPVATPAGTFDLDGYTYAYLLFHFLYAKSTYPYLPLMISDLAERRTDRIADFLGQVLSGGGGDNDFSTGLYYGVVCGELFNPPDPDAFAVANASTPAAIRDLFEGTWESLLATCASYPKGNLQAQLQQPVTSAVRTLVSSGRLDPITPPSFGDIAIASLSNAVHVVHEQSGHGATLQSTCGQQNLFAFLADPEGTHDTSCAATISTSFVLPTAFAAAAIPVERIRAELELVPVPPLVPRR